MANRDIKGPIFIVAIVALVAFVGFLLWKGTGPPTPTLAPDQDIKHPFGRGPIKGLMPQRMGPAQGPYSRH